MQGPPPDPRGGCPYPPGHRKKIARLRYRVMYGFALWHKDDAKNIAVEPDESKLTDKMYLDRQPHEMPRCRLVGRGLAEAKMIEWE